jgi:hypothetical protein
MAFDRVKHLSHRVVLTKLTGFVYKWYVFIARGGEWGESQERGPFTQESTLHAKGVSRETVGAQDRKGKSWLCKEVSEAMQSGS